jgi:hypothetical protein
VEKVQSDFKERLTIQALQSDIGGINFMDAYEDEGLANANRLKKQAEIGGYIVENYGKVIEAKAEKAVYDYEKEFWQNQPEEFNSDGIRTHIFQRNDRDMLKQHVRESLTSTAISIFVAPPVVIPWVENS